jgi:hypothetical protein
MTSAKFKPDSSVTLKWPITEGEPLLWGGSKAATDPLRETKEAPRHAGGWGGAATTHRQYEVSGQLQAVAALPHVEGKN